MMGAFTFTFSDLPPLVPSLPPPSSGAATSSFFPAAPPQDEEVHVPQAAAHQRSLQRVREVPASAPARPAAPAPFAPLGALPPQLAAYPPRYRSVFPYQGWNKLQTAVQAKAVNTDGETSIGSCGSSPL
jgi:hypothetical protein